MGIIIDLILLAIILINVLIGYKRGLIKVAFNIFAFIIALIVTLILVRPVSYLIINIAFFIPFYSRAFPMLILHHDRHLCKRPLSRCLVKALVLGVQSDHG